MLKYYVADAFADNVFEGDPAGVCVLDEWKPHEKMLKIAMENNLSETAFVVKEDDEGTYGIRWFTPVGEIDLCGHATLATAYKGLLDRMLKIIINVKNIEKYFTSIFV